MNIIRWISCCWIVLCWASPTLQHPSWAPPPRRPEWWAPWGAAPPWAMEGLAIDPWGYHQQKGQKDGHQQKVMNYGNWNLNKKLNLTRNMSRKAHVRQHETRLYMISKAASQINQQTLKVDSPRWWRSGDHVRSSPPNLQDQHIRARNIPSLHSFTMADVLMAKQTYLIIIIIIAILGCSRRLDPLHERGSPVGRRGFETGRNIRNIIRLSTNGIHLLLFSCHLSHSISR